MSKNIKSVPTQEYEEVVSTVAKYVEGLRVGSADGVAEAFHKDAVMYGLTNGELLGGPIKNLYDFVEKTAPRPTSRHGSTFSRSRRRRRWCAWTWKRTRSAPTTPTSTPLSSSTAPGRSSPRSFTCMKGKRPCPRAWRYAQHYNNSFCWPFIA